MKFSPLLVLFISAPVLAAPPKVDYLYPAGAQRGQKVEITLGGTFDPWPPQAWTSHPGLKVTPEKKAGQCTVAVAPDVPLGTHWIRFFNKDGAASLRPFLVNQVPEMLDREPNDSPGAAQAVKELPAIVNGRFEKPNDADVFSVSLKKGQTLVAAIEAYQTLRSPMDAVLQIVSPDGFVLAQNDDHRELDPLIAFTAPKDGSYLVRTFCFPSVPDSRVGLFGKETCVYRLTLTAGPYLDHSWPLAVNRSSPGTVELIGWNIPSESRLAKVPLDATFSSVPIQPPGFANSVSVRVEDHACKTASDGVLVAPVTVTGRVTDAKGHRFEFEAKKSQKLVLEIAAQRLHFPLDPVLIVLDPSGKQVQKVQSNKLHDDPTLEFMPTQDGKHTLVIRDLHEEGGPGHLFRLRLYPALPNFEAVLTNDRFTGPAANMVEAPITLTRKHGFKGEIVFTAQGLNPEARFELAASKDKKNDKLLLHNAKATNMPFRLFAQVKGRDETRRPVLAVLPEVQAQVPHLWIAPK